MLLAALDVRLPGLLATREIEGVQEEGGDVPDVGANLSASCLCMKAASWLLATVTNTSKSHEVI